MKFFLLEFHFHAGTLTKQALDGIIGCKINLTPFAYEVDFRICRSKLVMDRVLEVPWIMGLRQVEQKFSPLFVDIFDDFSKWSVHRSHCNSLKNH